ncbi:MAG: TonB-dependent receptor, partial [Telluria sp.]
MDRVLTGVNAITGSPLGASAWTVARTRQSVLQNNEILANLTNLTSEFKIGSVSHTVSSGLEFMSEKQLSTTRAGLGTVAAANLYQPNANDVVTGLNPVANGAYTRGSTTTAALYAFDTVKLSEQFHINGGVRAERYNTDTNAATFTTVVVPAPFLEKSDTLVSWKVGALYKPTPAGSIYAALANSKTPPGSANFALSAAASSVNRPNLDPQETRNAEIGTKWDVLEKKLALTAAVYRTENTNEIVPIDAAANIYSQLGKRRVQGVELGMVGQFTKAWQVTAGVAKMKATVIRGSTTGNTTTGADTRWSPELTATLWSSYNVNNKLTVGGGWRYSSEQKRLVDPTADVTRQNVQRIDSYAVADAMLSYKVAKNLSLQLNVYNLLDKDYVNTLNNGGARYSRGLERSAQLSASVIF